MFDSAEYDTYTACPVDAMLIGILTAIMVLSILFFGSYDDGEEYDN